MAKLKDGFYKQTAEAIGSNDFVLLAGGGSKALSDFAYKSDLTDFVTGYYWADQKISSTANYDTTPTVSSITAKSLFYLKSNDATLKIYPTAGIDANDFGNETVAIQSCFDGKDPVSSEYPIDYPIRTVIALQPRGGKVGIGTTSPRSKLDVYGTDAAVIIGKTNNNPGVSTARKLRLGLATAGHSGSQYWHFTTDDTTSNAYLQIHYGADDTGISIRHDGALGLGHNYPYQKLTVNGNIAFTSSGIIGTSYNASNTTMYNKITIHSATNGIMYDSGSWTSGDHQAHTFRTGNSSAERLVITNAGNVGIGTASPQQKLHVAGSVAISTYLYMPDNVSTYRTVIDRSGNNVLFGYGQGVAGYDVYYTGYNTHLNAGGGWNTSSNLTLLANGNVGIGTTNPTYKLDVNGNVRIQGGTTLKTGSSSSTYLSMHNTINGGVNIYAGYAKGEALRIDLASTTGGYVDNLLFLYNNGQLKTGGFIKQGSSDSYVLLGGGGHKLESSLSVNYATSAGNADTVDGYHWYNFVTAGSYDSHNFNSFYDRSYVGSIYATSNSPTGSELWFNTVQIAHRNGHSDGPGYISQIAIGMTGSKNKMWFRGSRTDSWTEVVTSVNISSYAITSRGYIGTTAVQASSSLQNLTGIGSINMAGDIIVASNGDTGTRQIRLCGGSNDFGRIAVGASANNAAWMEIATADDATEPIYVRQYTGTYTSLTRTLTLLDASGNSSFPGIITASSYVKASRFTLNNTGDDYCGLMPNSVITEGGNAADIWLYNKNKVCIYGSSIDLNNNVTLSGTLTINQSATTRNRGIIGSYDPNRAAAIWSMGSAYKIAADGTTLGNLYGAAYVYYGSGYTFGANYSLGHSFVWTQNGTPTAALGNNIWTSGVLETCSYLTFGYTGASFTSDIRSTWRQSLYGNTTNYSRFRTVRTDATIADFSEIYGSGITWATGDTQGYLSVSYASGKAFIGGGNSNKLNWSYQLLHSGNYNSYSPKLDGTGATGTWGISISGTASNADKLDGYHAYLMLSSTIYNYSTGCLVKTDIPTASNTMITFRIEGNSYGYDSILTTGLFYNYKDYNLILSASAIHHGYNFGNITVFCYDGYVYLWFKQQSNYLSYVVYVYGTNSDSNNRNRVTSITNAVIPSSGVTRSVTITPGNSSVSGGGSSAGSSITVKINGTSKTLTIPSSLPANGGTADKLSTVSKTAWGQTYWTSGGVPTSISGNMTGVGSITMTGSIKYAGTKNTYDMIKFIDNTSDVNGNGIAIGGGGTTIIGGGEAADLFITAGSGGTESLILASDAAITFYSNCQSGTSTAKSITMDANGYLNTSYIYYGGHEKNASNPSYVAGFNSSDNYIRSYATSSLSVSYATSAGSCTGNANGLTSTGYGNGNLTYFQTDGSFFGNTGWSHYIIANHGNGSNYYNFTLALPFWGSPKYKRLERGTEDGWHDFITSENISSQSVNYASSAGSVAWSNVTGKPSSFTPSTHYHNYFPENTPVYFRDPNSSTWRGGMYWGSAGNEALCFAVTHSNTSFRFFTGSDLASWTNSTWQNTPKLEINNGGINVNGNIILFANNSWLSPARVQIGRPDTTVYTDRSCIGTTDGNLHLDAYKDKAIYLNYYSSAGNIYFNGSSYCINGGYYNGRSADVTVNSSTSNSSYRLLWHSGNTIYGTGTAGNSGSMWCNPSLARIYANSFFENSDRTLKENIQPLLKELLDKIYNIKEVSFNWKSNGNQSFGYIALDFEEISEVFVDRGDDGTLTLGYTAALVAQVAALKLKIANLEERLHILERS